jgi:putative oxidoreductase
MAPFPDRPTYAMLSYMDGLATGASDFLVLIARVLVGWLLLASGWAKLINMANFVMYLTNLKVPSPELFQWAAVFEFLLGIALILGLATRYVAIATLLFVVVATLLGHRYWEYAGASQGAQYTHFLKNLAIMGGVVLVFVSGGGRYSLDNRLTKR